MKRFQGIFAVMLTLYDEKGGIDGQAMERLTHYLVDSGVHGLVVLGSNGECPYLPRDLQREAVEVVVKSCAKKIPVIVGINERGTEPSLEMARYAEKAGADGLLVALHIFYPLEENEVYAHYQKICASVDLPVLFYNYPSNTGLKLSPRSIARLAEIDGLVGAKETIFELSEVRELVELTGEDFCVFTGMTLNLAPTMAVGACGAICPLPNFIPQKTVELYQAASSGDRERAEALQNEVLACAPLIASTLTPHAMQKEALRLLGHPVNTAVMGPLPQLTVEQAQLVRDTLKNLGLIE